VSSFIHVPVEHKQGIGVEDLTPTYEPFAIGGAIYHTTSWNNACQQFWMLAKQ
jgi:hypothetical protein